MHNLLLYHTFLTFNDFKKEAVWKHMKKKIMLVTSIFSFSHNVFYPSQYKFQFFSQIIIFHRLQMLSLWTSLKNFVICINCKDLTYLNLFHVWMTVVALLKFYTSYLPAVSVLQKKNKEFGNIISLRVDYGILVNLQKGRNWHTNCT